MWIKSSDYGNGVKNYKLVPYRSLAVDKKTIPYGSVIFIPAIVGYQITMSNSTILTHDGYFFAADTGSAVLENHIDIFTGIDTKNPFPNIITSKPKDIFKAYLVKDSKIIDTLKQLHTK